MSRCEPPAGTTPFRSITYHWLTNTDPADVRIGEWQAADDLGQGYWRAPIPKKPEDAYDAGWRYLRPVPTPEELDALLKAARAVASEFAQQHPLIADLNAALAAPSLKERADGE